MGFILRPCRSELLCADEVLTWLGVSRWDSSFERVKTVRAPLLSILQRGTCISLGAPKLHVHIKKVLCYMGLKW